MLDFCHFRQVSQETGIWTSIATGDLFIKITCFDKQSYHIIRECTIFNRALLLGATKAICRDWRLVQHMR